MRRRHVKKRRIATNETVQLFRSSYLLIIVTALLFAGLVSGSILAKNTGIGKSSFELFLQPSLYVGVKPEKFWNLMISSFFSTSVLLCAAFVLGLCAAGLPGLLFIPFFKGAGIGYSIAFLYLKYGLHGVAFSALCILPQAVLCSIAIIISCREGVRFSFKICSAISPSSKQTDLWEPFWNYCFKYVICFVFVAIASLLASLTIIAFSGLLS